MSDKNYTEAEVERWAKCGCTVMLAGGIGSTEEHWSKAERFLDKAQEYGMKLIFDCGAGSYYGCNESNVAQREEAFRKVYERFKGHPALYGFHAGDEPSTTDGLEGTVLALGLQRRVAPELDPYINLAGSTWKMDGKFNGLTFTQWMKRLKDEANCRVVCFDNYAQTINDGGRTDYFRIIKNMVEAAEAAGLECWETPLCSAHIAYKSMDEYGIMWQITTSAALGIKGITWFRFYDRQIAPNYHASPIDEYGNTTLTYERMMRCHRRFNDQFGELLMRLKRKESWMLGFQRMSYPMFGENSHPLIKDIKSFERMVISTFEDENGTEYLCLVNAELEQHTTVQVTYDREKCRLTELILNGTIEGRYRSGGDISLYPGQMAIYRIDRR